MADHSAALPTSEVVSQLVVDEDNPQRSTQKIGRPNGVTSSNRFFDILKQLTFLTVIPHPVHPDGCLRRIVASSVVLPLAETSYMLWKTGMFLDCDVQIIVSHNYNSQWIAAENLPAGFKRYTSRRSGCSFDRTRYVHRITQPLVSNLPHHQDLFPCSFDFKFYCLFIFVSATSIPKVGAAWKLLQS